MMHLTRRGRTAIAATVVLALAGGGLYAYKEVTGLVLVERCAASTTAGKVSVSPEQAGNAATIAGVGVRRKLPERAVVIAIATAMQESKLRNLPHGDRDSLGLFQQRPSQGWGTAGQLRDPLYASERFYDELLKVPEYRNLPLTVAAQRVQRSATPQAYAKHENEAQVLATGLTGRAGKAVTCAIRPDNYTYQAMGASGLTPRGNRVRQELRRTFGKLSVGGFAPGGVRSGHVTGSAHDDGRAFDVAVGQPTAAHRRTGWAVAQWAVSRADGLGVTEVIYDGSIWTARRSGEGWRAYHPSEGSTSNPVVMHREHVRIGVERGD
jgi:hypothetical protein